MSYKIIWSPMARISYVEILQNFDDRHSQAKLEIFETHVREVLDFISQFPQSTNTRQPMILTGVCWLSSRVYIIA